MWTKTGIAFEPITSYQTLENAKEALTKRWAPLYQKNVFLTGWLVIMGGGVKPKDHAVWIGKDTPLPFPDFEKELTEGRTS